ncbi:MAG: uracil-DNA glycosylase [Desulfobacterales bacterium]
MTAFHKEGDSQPRDPSGSCKENFIAALDGITRHLRSLADIGCEGLDCSAENLKRINAWGCSAFSSVETLEEIYTDIDDCRRCKLSESRNHIVFGAGNPKARLVFIGEGPGYDEDQKGEPFVGAAGRLLTKIIQAIKLKREDVYICNIVKCRPPRNRNPLPDEIKACFPFLRRQISAIEPEVICTLGSVAVQSLLDIREPISKVRGNLYKYHNITVIPTFHPAYLLRNPEKKRDVWEDMKKLMDLQ